MQIRLDRTGYPLIRIRPIEAFAHLLPVTKVQFERYLSDCQAVPNAAFYMEVLNVNARISPKHTTRDNYWGLLATGITPKEAMLCASWMGTGYDLPTSDEWKAMYRHFGDIDLAKLNTALLQESKLNDLARLTWTSIINVLNPRSSQQAALLKDGVLEWVRTNSREQPWGGLGKPNQRLHSMIIDL